MLYLHIPFCKQACSYCNFHFSTSSKGRDEVLAAMHRELEARAPEWSQHQFRTVYFGGGTPSLLTAEELSAFISIINHYDPPQDHTGYREITLEANPDDLTDDKVAALANSPVNRLSIGIQSFAQVDLRFMNRAHTATEAATVLDRVKRAGFQDISVDLIYGSPTTTDAIWEDNISRIIDQGVAHISAYALTVEPRTALAHQVKTGQVKSPSEERFSHQYLRLIERLTEAGYEHYEISNFALPGRYSRHNTAYWRGLPYAGIGPSAHSFDGTGTRWWNIANNALYTKGMSTVRTEADYHEAPGLYEAEKLSRSDRYNEFIMTGLRTQWGVAVADLRERFGEDFRRHFIDSMADAIQLGYFEVSYLEKGLYRLTPAGRRLADGIASDGFWL